MREQHDDKNMVPRNLRLKRERQFIERTAFVVFVVALICFLGAVGIFFSLKALFDMTHPVSADMQQVLAALLNVVPMTFAITGVACVGVSFLLLLVQYLDVALAHVAWKRTLRKGGRQ